QEVGTPVSFVVKSLHHQVLPAPDPAAMVAFKRRAEELDRVAGTTRSALSAAASEMDLIRQAIARMELSDDQWLEQIIRLQKRTLTLQRRLSGDPLQARLDMDPVPPAGARIGRVINEAKYSRAAPTATHQVSLDIAEKELRTIVEEVRVLAGSELPMLREKLQRYGAPYTPNAIPAFRDQQNEGRHR